MIGNDSLALALREANNQNKKPIIILAHHAPDSFTKDERILVAVSGGKDSLALMLELQLQGYNVTGLPANFVIDREGNIAGKNLYGEALERKIKELL